MWRRTRWASRRRNGDQRRPLAGGSQNLTSRVFGLGGSWTGMKGAGRCWHMGGSLRLPGEYDSVVGSSLEAGTDQAPLMTGRTVISSSDSGSYYAAAGFGIVHTHAVAAADAIT